jgi:hypothetical protein|tara:strand:+ start:456 stop:629 length:174 start_codon:yes stop_codon:yes gene_type:complete
MLLIEKDELRFAEFCVLEYLEYLESDSPQKLSFDEYVSQFRYVLLEKWRNDAHPIIH